jgi:hypothetical protein
MFYIFRQWRFVRFLNHDIEANNKRYPDDATYGEGYQILVQDLITEYSARRFVKAAPVKVRGIASSCVTNGFLDEHERNGYPYLSINNGKGRKFVSPLGLVEEELEQFSGAVQFVFGGGVASIVWVLYRVFAK